MIRRVVLLVALVLTLLGLVGGMAPPGPTFSLVPAAAQEALVDLA
jgi:hypothetical protein